MYTVITAELLRLGEGGTDIVFYMFWWSHRAGKIFEYDYEISVYQTTLMETFLFFNLISWFKQH